MRSLICTYIKMAVVLVILLAGFGISSSDWLLLQPITPPSIMTRKNVEFCGAPEQNYLNLHNLTSKTYIKNEKKFMNFFDWKLYSTDIIEILRLFKTLPQETTEKLKLITGIEKKLVAETEKRINEFFPSKSRQRRTTHLHFSSMESSLMTISMLLFGVYLTKMIQRLLQSHYSRYNQSMAVMGGVRSPIRIIKGRKVKYTEEELKMILLIEKLNDRFN